MTQSTTSVVTSVAIRGGIGLWNINGKEGVRLQDIINKLLGAQVAKDLPSGRQADLVATAEQKALLKGNLGGTCRIFDYDVTTGFRVV